MADLIEIFFAIGSAAQTASSMLSTASSLASSSSKPQSSCPPIVAPKKNRARDDGSRNARQMG